MTETFIAMGPPGRNSRRFREVASSSPCDGCPAPCCRMVLTPHPVPATFTDLDYVRYLLGFPETEVVVHQDGSWQHVSHRQCGLFNETTTGCTVHGTDRKPKVCVYFDPYKCWYKRNFTTDDPPDIVRLDAARFEILLSLCELDDDGRLTRVPAWEELRELVMTSGADQAGSGSAAR